MVSNAISLDQLLPVPPPEKAKSGCGSCGSGEAASKCGNGLEKIYPTTAVRFGFMRYIGEFAHAPDMKFTCGAKVVIQTKRGIEIGEQVSLTCGGCDKSVSRDQMKDWVDACGKDAFIFDAGRILREATAADLAEYARIQQSAKAKKDFCQQVSRRQNLPLKVVDCECPFGGERIIFYFMSEERVDFRNMVRDLAAEFRTRIEMRQVGARDEARLLADYETCGREVCCKVFLKTLRPVSMKMAKMQKATLDPSKVSGRCGRLKCCLRYEHTTYEELDAKLPRQGAFVRTAHGDGIVVKRQTLTQLVQIRGEDDGFTTVVVEDVFEVEGKVVPGKEEALLELQNRPQRPVRPAPPEPRREMRRPMPKRDAEPADRTAPRDVEDVTEEEPAAGLREAPPGFFVEDDEETDEAPAAGRSSADGDEPDAGPERTAGERPGPPDGDAAPGRPRGRVRRRGRRRRRGGGGGGGSGGGPGGGQGGGPGGGGAPPGGNSGG